MNRASLAKGYTLLELTVVIAIVLLASVAVVAGVQSVRKASLSSAAATLSAAIRYLYDLAVLNSRPYRLVISLGQGKFRGEEVGEGCSSALLPSEEERRYEVEKKGQREGQVSTKAPEEAPVLPRFKDNLLGERSLPKGIEFKGVMTSHQDEVTEEGEAEIYFFPSGYVEKALIYLRKGETIYTVETIPLRGIGRIHTEEVDPRVVMEGS